MRRQIDIVNLFIIVNLYLWHLKCYFLIMSMHRVMFVPKGRFQFVGLVFSLLLFGWPIASRAFTKAGNVYTTDGSFGDVNAACYSATTGGIVQIPAGNFTWQGNNGTLMYLAVNGVTLQGSGTNATFITLSNFTGSAWTTAAINIQAKVTIKDFSLSVADNCNATPFFGGGANGWRISNINCHVGYSSGYFLAFATYGLLDHCAIDGSSGDQELIFGRGPADSWQTPDSVGTTNAMVIENCTFTGQGYVCDANSNARLVVRFCTMQGTQKIDGHGKASNYPPRGIRQMEAYGNTWPTKGIGAYWPFIELRGGCGYVFNNLVADDTYPLRGVTRLSEYSSFQSLPNFNYTYSTPYSWPADDQIGVGMDPKVGGSDPLYLWGNLKGGQPNPLTWEAIPSDAITLYQHQSSGGIWASGSTSVAGLTNSPYVWSDTLAWSLTVTNSDYRYAFQNSGSPSLRAFTNAYTFNYYLWQTNEFGTMIRGLWTNGSGQAYYSDPNRNMAFMGTYPIDTVTRTNVFFYYTNGMLTGTLTWFPTNGATGIWTTTNPPGTTAKTGGWTNSAGKIMVDGTDFFKTAIYVCDSRNVNTISKSGIWFSASAYSSNQRISWATVSATGTFSTTNGSGIDQTTVSFTEQDLIKADRDYFNQTNNFNGSSGVGVGAKAQMSAIRPTKSGVGFWVTDEGNWNNLAATNHSGQLYTWNGSAWVLKYVPLTYPYGSTANLYVPPQPGPPRVNPDIITAYKNTAVTYSPLTNDVVISPGGYLTIVGLAATNGTATTDGTNVKFTPAYGFLGTATLGYQVSDNVGYTNSAVDTIQVTNLPAGFGSPDNPSIWYKFWGNTLDSGAYGNDGTSHTNMVYTNGVDGTNNHAALFSGNGYYFGDKVPAYVQSPLFPNGVPPTNWSVSAWFKPSVIDNLPRMIAGYAPMYGGGNGDAMLLISNGVVFGKTFVGTLGQMVVISTNVVPTNKWTHAVFEQDNSGNLILFVNGIQVGSVAGGPTYYSYPTYFFVGGHGDYERDFAGAIADVRLFNNYALTAADVARIYGAGLMPSSPPAILVPPSRLKFSTNAIVPP